MYCFSRACTSPLKEKQSRPQNNMVTDNSSVGQTVHITLDKLVQPLAHEHEETRSDAFLATINSSVLSTHNMSRHSQNQTTTELHLPPPTRSLPVSEISHTRSTQPSSHSKRLSFARKPDRSTSDLEWWQHRVPRSVVIVVARQRSSTHQIHRRVMASEQHGQCSLPTSRRSNPQTFPPRSGCLYRPGYFCTATHSPPRRSHDPFHLRGLNTRLL